MATKLEKYLFDEGMTKADLARESGVAWNSISKIVGGKSALSNITLTNAHRMARALGMGIDEFYQRFSESIDDLELVDGWNPLNGLEILIEDGKIIKATDGEDTKYPFVKNGREWDQVENLSINDFKMLIRQGKLIWK